MQVRGYSQPGDLIEMVLDHPPGPTGLRMRGGGGDSQSQARTGPCWLGRPGRGGVRSLGKWAPVQAGKGKKTDGPPKPPGVAPTDTGISARRDPSVSDLQALRESVLY